MLNQVILVGHLGKDPDMRFTGTGKAVCTMSVATSETWKDDSGTKHEQVQWHRVIAWQKLAENCGKYLAKGRPVTVIGKVTYRSFDNKDGQKVYLTEIIANHVIFLPSKDGGGQREEHDQGRSSSSSSSSSSNVSDGGDPPFDENEF